MIRFALRDADVRELIMAYPWLGLTFSNPQCQSAMKISRANLIVSPKFVGCRSFGVRRRRTEGRLTMS